MGPQNKEFGYMEKIKTYLQIFINFFYLHTKDACIKNKK